MLIQIAMKRRTTIQILCEFFAVKNEFIYDCSRRVFNDVKITVIAFTRNFIAIFSIPFSMFNTEIFCLSVTL